MEIQSFPASIMVFVSFRGKVKTILTGANKKSMRRGVGKMNWRSGKVGYEF